MDLELFEEIVEAIHKGLGHHGKKKTLDAVAGRYIIAMERRSQGTRRLRALPALQACPSTFRQSSTQRFILNFEKCQFFNTESRFSGHILTRDGCTPDPRNIEKVVRWLTPRAITDVRGFNNLANHYRRYIKGFATLALKPTHQPSQRVASQRSSDYVDGEGGLRIHIGGA